MPKQIHKDWFNQLKSGDTQPLQKLLEMYGENCVRQLIHKGVGSREEAQGLFLDALLELREKIMDGRLQTISTPDGYLYGTARNMFLKTQKAKVKKITAQDDVLRYFYEYEKEFDVLANTERMEEETATKQARINTMLQAFHKLGEKCQRLLKLFYIENQKMEIIAQQLNLKNAQTAKATKSRCMRKWHDELIKN